MTDLPDVVVDVHSHVFNADDLPIDGFVKKLFEAPRLLTGVLSVPLDRLSQWRAPNDERQRLLHMIGPLGGLESLTRDDGGVELIGDAELDRLFEEDWQRLRLLGDTEGVSGLEAADAGVSDGQLAAALASAPPDEAHELEAWLEEWDPAIRGLEGLEGFPNPLRKVRDAKRAAGRFVQALRLVTRYRHAVAAELVRTYPQVSLFVPALVDFSHTTSDKPSADIREQIALHSLVAKVSIVGRLPGVRPQQPTRIAPFVGFDPYREVAETALKLWDPDRGTKNPYVPYADPGNAGADDRYHRDIRFVLGRARRLHEPQTEEWGEASLDLTEVRGGIDLVRHAIELGGFTGVKLYPPAGFLPLGNALRFGGTKGEQLDAALRCLYAYCVAMDVPILAHAAHSNGFEDAYNSFAGPAGWELVLREYPALRLCLGHFGHLHGIGTDAANPSLDGWPSRFLALIDRHPNVYADLGNSKFPLSDEYKRRFLSLLAVLLGGDDPDDAQRERRRRLLYGSDFWMNTLSPDHTSYLERFESGVNEAFGSSTAKAFMGHNALRYLGFNGDDDQPAFGNCNRKRYVDFHGPHPTPPWLPREA